jgi:Predicted membrane protein
MALALALLAAWAGIRGHRLAMWVLCLLVLACKEDQVYTVGVIGILMAAHGAPEVRKHWRFIVYLAGAWFLIGTGIVQQHFRNGGYTDFVYYRWLIGLDPSMPATVSTVLGAMFRPSALLVVAVVIASMFALPLLAPRWLLLVIPPYLANVLSGHTPQNVLHLHYVLLLLFPLVVAGGVGARKFLEMRSIRPAAALIAILPALLLAWGTGRFPPALGGDPSLYSHPNTVAELQTATSMIPADAPVNADDGLAVWLANRQTINDFPDRLDAKCYVVLDHNAYLSGPTDPLKRQAAIDQLPTSGRRLLFDDGHFQVWSPVGD